MSVIIPAFNGGAWLAQAIESALAQTYPNTQIIVVNDGSTDPCTRETAITYLPHITYIEQENVGVAAARNTGIEASTGELIALLDQDDLWLPHKLQTQVSILNARPHLGLVHSSFQVINANSRPTGAIRLPQREYDPLPSLLLQVPIASCTALFPRRLLNETGQFDAALAGSDDWDLWLRIASQGYNFYCVGEPLAQYREHASNTSRNIDLMVRASINTLDKFYARTDIPASAMRSRDRAYFNKHAWAIALYYGARRTKCAQDHLQIAARSYPQGIATGRFLQSLIHANQQAGGTAPGQADIHEAARFVQHTLAQAAIPPQIRRAISRKIAARTRLLLALHSRQPAQMVGALLQDPSLLIDSEIWAALRRRTGSLLTRFYLSTRLSR